MAIAHPTVLKTFKGSKDSLADSIVKKKASDEQKKAVWDFEPIANRSQWCTFNFSSGSTGKPKIQIYKNQVTMKLLNTDNTGMKDIIGLRRGFQIRQGATHIFIYKTFYLTPR